MSGDLSDWKGDHCERGEGRALIYYVSRGSVGEIGACNH